MSWVRFDLHLHTEFSPDCDTALAVIEAHCLGRGLTGIAVTDHDTIEGALRLRERAHTLQVIVGEEVTTRDGDVIGLFLQERIPPGMPALDTMEAIHAQGGLVYLPHPFDKRRARKSKGASLHALLPWIDIVEIFNGKIARGEYNRLAAEFARQYHKPGAGGSDAHTLRAIGAVTNAFELPEGTLTPASLLKGLEGVHLTGTRRSPLAGWLVRGRRPISLIWRRLRQGIS